MSTAPVRVAIVGDDQTAAALGTAQTKIESFKQAAEGAGVGMEASMMRARGGIALAAEEMDLKLNRHLRSAILELFPGVARAAALAFPAFALIAFVGILEKVPTVIAEGTDSLMGFGEAEKKQFEAAIEGNKKLISLAEDQKRLRSEIAAMSGSAHAKEAAALAASKASLEDLHSQMLILLNDQKTLKDLAGLGELKGFGAGAAAGSMFGPLGSMAGGFLGSKIGGMADDKTLQAALAKDGQDIIEKHAEIQKAILETKKKHGEMANSVRDDFKKIDDAIREAAAFVEAHSSDFIQKASAPYDKQIEALSLLTPMTVKQFAAISMLNAALQDEKNTAVAEQWTKLADEFHKINDEISKLQLEKLSKFMKVVNTKDQMKSALGPSMFNPDFYKQAAGEQMALYWKTHIGAAAEAFNALDSTAKDTFSNMNMYFAQGGAGLKQWGNLVIGELEKVIAEEFYTLVITKLLTAAFGAFGIGMPSSSQMVSASDISRFHLPGMGITGLPPRAGGGPVYAGMAYMVGERGPEPFVPSTNGTIIPNGGGAGGAQNLTVHIINESSHPVEARQGSMRLDLHTMMAEVYLQDAQTGGTMSQVRRMERS